jgi:hypothetical protein
MIAKTVAGSAHAGKDKQRRLPANETPESQEGR